MIQLAYCTRPPVALGYWNYERKKLHLMIQRGELAMDAASAADEIRRVIRRELDDVERAIKAKDDRKALSELDDAVRKLKRIANDLA